MSIEHIENMEKIIGKIAGDKYYQVNYTVTKLGKVRNIKWSVWIGQKYYWGQCPIDLLKKIRNNTGKNLIDYYIGTLSEGE